MGRIVVSREFDDYLATMAAFQEERKIFFTTIRNVMEYWLKLEKVELRYSPGQRQVKVCN